MRSASMRSTPRWLGSLAVLAAGVLLAAAEPAVEPSAEPATDSSVEAPIAASSSTGAPLVHVVTIDSIIQPVVAEHVADAVSRAADQGAELLVLELNTPGGLIISTREMTSVMLETETPVVVYVTPQGSQAASAGFFLLMAADVAAMAPGTNTGAAHPVGPQGGDIAGDMGEKVEQDTAAWVRELAVRNGRDALLAESAVLESKSFAASEALDNGLIDVVAPTLDDLLTQLDGRILQRADGADRVLTTRGARVERQQMSQFQMIRSVLVQPNIAFLLLTIGGIGLTMEIYNPGALFPGVAGAISFLLGLYGMSLLPVNIVGVAFLVLASVLFLAEIQTGGFGLLGSGGIVSLILGGLMLFRSADPALRVSLELIVGLAIVSGLSVGFLATLAWRARRNPVRGGREGLLRARGRARSTFVPDERSGTAWRGKVDLHGEIWTAQAAEPVAAGSTVAVRAVDGLMVEVEVLRP